MPKHAENPGREVVLLDATDTPRIVSVATTEQARKVRQQIDGVDYYHVGEDADGRWTYRPMPKQ